MKAGSVLRLWPALLKLTTVKMFETNEKSRTQVSMDLDELLSLLDFDDDLVL